MTFWLGVAVVYSVIIAVGLALGLAFGSGRSGGSTVVPDPREPEPIDGKTLVDV